MNGNNQPQHEQHHITERIARLETAVDYQSQAISVLREEMRAGFSRADASVNTGFAHVDDKFAHVNDKFAHVDDQFARVDAQFARVDAEFVRVHEQLMKIRTTDFRILLSISLTTALGTLSLIVKVFGLL
ncbi:hypothetical protein [Duganella vulcania]|uniref:DUF1640 domain-containing protein n=1 Tax=Duganella vulcania TaxID=2692166 RepID=A0A845GKG3_9BURK|nr:hypothetical protein [Duganella vulcania]MYM93875.1 hypothetical protein [Duganella vulcania]